MPGSTLHTVDAGGGGLLELIINGVYFTQDFSYWTSSRLRQNKFTHIVYVDRKAALQGRSPTSPLMDLDPNEFECLELNFRSALVLPNLYKSDKFIAKALQNEGKLLIMEPAGANYQKSIAIILGYLMYNFKLGFEWVYDRDQMCTSNSIINPRNNPSRKAFDVLCKAYRSKVELDRFLIMQLYEYEPILEVRRETEEMGHSRSGERLRSVLKRARDASFEETATTLDYHNNNNNSRIEGDDEEEGDSDHNLVDVQDVGEGEATLYLTSNNFNHNLNTINNNQSHFPNMNRLANHPTAEAFETMIEWNWNGVCDTVWRLASSGITFNAKRIVNMMMNMDKGVAKDA